MGAWVKELRENVAEVVPLIRPETPDAPETARGVVLGSIQVDPEAIQQIIRQEIRSAVTDVERNLGLDNLTNLLHDLPAAIRQQQETVAQLRQQLDDARVELETAEAMLITAISEEIDPKTGKPVYSNETARRAALAQRRSSDPAYAAAASKVRELESALASAQADLDLLLNRFTSARKLADLTAARLNLLAA